jgi:hypothetical protein
VTETSSLESLIQLLHFGMRPAKTDSDCRLPSKGRVSFHEAAPETEESRALLLYYFVGLTTLIQDDQRCRDQP